MNSVRHILEMKGNYIWTIRKDQTVYEALRLMADKGTGAVVVMEGDELIGILSERDYARKVILLGRTSRETLVSEIMSSPVFTIHPDQTIEEAMELMTYRHVRHLPVSDDGGKHLIGVISIGDVVRSVIYFQRETIKSLEDTIGQQREIITDLREKIGRDGNFTPRVERLTK